jgi:hypothetical protein
MAGNRAQVRTDAQRLTVASRGPRIPCRRLVLPRGRPLVVRQRPRLPAFRSSAWAGRAEISEPGPKNGL